MGGGLWVFHSGPTLESGKEGTLDVDCFGEVLISTWGWTRGPGGLLHKKTHVEHRAVFHPLLPDLFPWVNNAPPQFFMRSKYRDP